MGGLLLASRGDALTPYLFDELEDRYPCHSRLPGIDLSAPQRALVAATTVRWPRARWAERYFKSGLGYHLRSRNATRALVRLGAPSAAVFQVHALFEVRNAPTILYVDCTHAQSAARWPAWNPLNGRALARWCERERAAYTAAEHVFSFSEETRSSLVGDYGVQPERISVVGAGVNAQRLPDRRVASAGPHPSGSGRAGGAPRILFVGNDFVRKGGLVLLKAFEEVRAEYPGARLDLVGTRPDIPPQPGVNVRGRVWDRQELHQLYRDADAFALPSLFDPYPLALLEAMAHGLPTVTTPTCGVPDVVTDGVNGLVVPAGDVGALARALIQLIEDPGTAAAVGAAARRRVEEAFTWAHVVDRMSPVLDVVAACAPR